MAKLFGILDKSKHDTSSKSKSAILRSMFDSFGFGKADYAISDEFGVGHIRIPSMSRKGIAENKNSIVCFTGEIFDYGEGPAEEYILNSYNTSGTKFIDNLNGSFVFLIYDKNEKKILIVNDRYGMKPLYYYADKYKIVFGSEIKAIIVDNHIKRKINWGYWRDYFSYGYALGSKTPFENIYSLPNASILEYSRGKIKIIKYWDYDRIKINHERTEKETIAEGADVLERVFIRQAGDINECNVLLSGGYDSRCIVSAIKKYTDVKINAYTIPKKNVGSNTFKDKDARYSRLVAKKLKLNHKIVGSEARHYEKYLRRFIEQQEAMGFENMWMMPIINHINSKYKNFDGIAGDVFLKAGYLSKPSFSYHTDLTNEKMIRKISNKKLASLINGHLFDISLIDSDSIIPYFSGKIKDDIKSDLRSIIEGLNSIKKHENRVKFFQAKNRTKNIIAMAPSNLIMRKTYSRMPFLDNEFVEFALSVPMDMKIRSDIYRKIMEKAFPEIMNIPTTNDIQGIKTKFKAFLLRYRLDFLRYAIGTMMNMFRIEDYKKIDKKPMAKLSDNPKDVMYLVNLAKKMEMPNFIDKDKLISDIDEHIAVDKDPTYFLEPIMHFCLWFNNFYIGKEKTDNVIRRIK